MPSKLEQLKTMTTVVADSGDIESIRVYEPMDSTTNPSLILKASGIPGYSRFIDETLVWGRSHGHVTSQIVDRLAVNFGAELTTIVPGRVSTEVDADLSFDTEGTLTKARAIIADYASRGIDKSRILIKIAGTWEGIQAVKILQKEGIDCNVTLIFHLAQAIAAADAGAFLISPFVGRILDWHKKHDGKTFSPETDPGVISVREIYAYYKAYGIKTIVMGASFRSIGEIEALAGCDRLTISPDLLKELAADNGDLVRKLDPQSAAKKAPAKIEMDEKTFRLMINMDPMATEMLAEGIRKFAADLQTLREMISNRLKEAA
jgi:transaldolase